jgi:hypothetical protein
MDVKVIPMSYSGASGVGESKPCYQKETDRQYRGSNMSIKRILLKWVVGPMHEEKYLI